MKKVLVFILTIGIMAAFTSCQTQHDCPNYGKVETEQTHS